MLYEKVPYLVNFLSETEKMASELIRNFVYLFSLFVFLLPNGEERCVTTVSVHK